MPHVAVQNTNGTEEHTLWAKQAGKNRGKCVPDLKAGFLSAGVFARAPAFLQPGEHPSETTHQAGSASTETSNFPRKQRDTNPIPYSRPMHQTAEIKFRAKSILMCIQGL
jgi:hypothetical protein